MFRQIFFLLNFCLSLTLINALNSSSLHHNSVPYEVKCLKHIMEVRVNLNDIQDPVIYLEKLKGFSICKPELTSSEAVFSLPLDDDMFYTCGTTKIHNKITGSKIFYNRIIIEHSVNKSQDSIFFKCVVPSDALLMQFRNKRQSGAELPLNFTEIDLPENFMEAEELDFTDNITAQAPYPYLNIKVRRNGVFVDTALNVQPGTPLEMIIYLDEDSRHVYGLLTSFLKVTDNTSRQQEEVIILNGCSIDPYIFGNFETLDGGDSLSAKFRAFKFPESNYVMFVGTVNVCLNECKGVPCGNGQYGFGRKKRSIPDEIPADPNKIFEIEMTTFLKVDYSGEHFPIKKGSIESRFDDNVNDAIVLSNESQTNSNQVNRLPFVQNASVKILILPINAMILLLYCYLVVV